MGALKRAIIAAGSAAVLALAACGGGSAGSAGAGATLGTTGDGGVAASPAGGTGSTDGAGGSVGSGSAGQTDALLLERQLELLEVGEGYLQCAKDLEVLGEPFSSGPSVWISSGLDDPLELWSSGLPFVSLCLHGFSDSAAIELTTVAGDFTVRSVAVPVEQITVAYGSQSPHTLFEEGARLQVRLEDREAMILQSPYWSFLPPAQVFREMSASDSITIRASQRGISAETVQPFRAPAEPGSFLVAPLPIGDVRLLVWGYPAGYVVPIGLYTLSDDPTSFSLQLIEQIGIVTMPRYRVAEFVVPSRVLDGRPASFYCLLPPTPAGERAHCDQIWPEYPGLVRTTDRGEKVLRWQDILMSADIINNTPENRTGHYDVLQTRLVAAWQASSGVVADGVLGPDLYAAITGAVAPNG